MTRSDDLAVASHERTLARHLFADRRPPGRSELFARPATVVPGTLS